MRWTGSCFILIFFFGATLLVGCSDAAGWQLVDLPDESIPLPMNGRFRRPNVQDLEVKMRDRMYDSVDQVLLTYHDPGRGDVVFMGSSRWSGGEWHTRDWDQPVEYMVHRMGGVTDRHTRFYYVAVWRNSSEVSQILIEVNGQSFDVEGEDIIVLRWEAPMHGAVEHLEVTAFDEDGKVIWQDEW